jgi:hypothetical protein
MANTRAMRFNTASSPQADIRVQSYMESVQLDVAFTHELPRMLQEPIYHIFHYIELFELLCKVAPQSEKGDSAKLLQALSSIRPIKVAIERLKVATDPNRIRPFLKFDHRSSASSRQIRLCQFNIGDWRGPDLLGSASRLLRSGEVHIWSEKRKNLSERTMFVLDTTVLLCKPASDKRDTAQFRLKERLPTAGLVVESDAAVPPKHGSEYTAALRLVPAANADDSGPILILVHSDVAKGVWEAAVCYTATQRVLEEAYQQRESEYERTLPQLIPKSDGYVTPPAPTGPTQALRYG